MMIELNLSLNIFYGELIRSFTNIETISGEIEKKNMLKEFKERISFLVSEIKDENLSYGWLDKNKFYCSYFININQEFYMTAIKK